MKALTFILFFIPIVAMSQDSVTIQTSKRSINAPLQEGEVVYQHVYEYDSSYTDDEIYNQIKPVLSTLFIGPGVSNQYDLFKVHGIDKQVISEDPLSRMVYAHIMFTTKELPGDPKEIKPGALVVANVKAMVKNHKMKLIIENIKTYYNSAGMSLLVGYQYSLLNLDVNQIIKNSKDKRVVQINGEQGKFMLTTIYKMSNVIINEIFYGIDKGIKRMKF